jgi:hypothetical protein
VTRTEATLLVEAGDSDSRHYKKSSVPQKPKGHISSFAGSDCKPIVEQPAVGLRAAVFGRRTSHCDTTTMNTTRRPTTDADEPTRSHRSHEKSAAGTARGTRKPQDGGRTNLLVPIVPASHDKVMVRSVRTCGRARTRSGVSSLYHCVNRRNDGNERFHTRAVWRLSRSGSRSGGRNETDGRGNETRGEA